MIQIQGIHKILYLKKIGLWIPHSNFLRGIYVHRSQCVYAGLNPLTARCQIGHR